MKKIGVISLFGRFNYGNRLQNYATCKICEMQGISAESLVLGKRFSLRRETKRIVKRVLGRPEAPRVEESMNRLRLEAFDRFNELIPIRNVAHVDRELSREYSYFVVGSDQVWNPRFFAYNEDWYFLRFAEKKQRIALAPSIGLNELSLLQGATIARGVRGFSHLSVREKRGAELIREYAGMNASIICDPTLVIPAEEWARIADHRLTPKVPYVFMYLLGGDQRFGDVVSKVSDNGKLSAVALSDRDGSDEIPAGPAEFLSLISSASHVVTDSFHAAIFSSIFHTPLTIVRREGGASMFSRLETLSRTLGIEEKVYGSPSYDPMRAGDYDGVDDAIAREREKFINFFKDSLMTNCFEGRKSCRG